jgi:hypothetical protein
MIMRKAGSIVVSVVSSTVLAAAVTLALGWPSRVNAVGDEEQAAQQQAELAKQQAAPENAALAQNESKIGDLDVTATLAMSETNPGREVILLECNNPTEGRIAGQVKLALTRTSGSGGERVMPTPQIAWRGNIAVDVEPGGKLVREVMLPKNIGAEVMRIAKLQKAAEESENVRYPNVYFGVDAQPVEPPAPRNAVAQRLAKQMNKSNAVALVNSAPTVPAGSLAPASPATKLVESISKRGVDIDLDDDQPAVAPVQAATPTAAAPVAKSATATSVAPTAPAAAASKAVTAWPQGRSSLVQPVSLSSSKVIAMPNRRGGDFGY